MRRCPRAAAPRIHAREAVDRHRRRRAARASARSSRRSDSAAPPGRSTRTPSLAASMRAYDLAERRREIDAVARRRRASTSKFAAAPSLPRRADKPPVRRRTAGRRVAAGVDRRGGAVVQPARSSDAHASATRRTRSGKSRALRTPRSARRASLRIAAHRFEQHALSGVVLSCDCQTSLRARRDRPSPTALRPDARRSRRRAARHRAAQVASPRRRACPSRKSAQPMLSRMNGSSGESLCAFSISAKPSLVRGVRSTSV